MRKCFSHFGQTFKLSSRSFFQMICRQFSHFTHKPSVRTVFLPEVSSSPPSRLNQAIRILPSGDRVILRLETLKSPNRPITQSPDQYSIPLCAITPFS